jgi:thiol-disulfide isomerase/thioredoxin
MKHFLFAGLPCAFLLTACEPSEPSFSVTGALVGVERVFVSKVTPENLEPIDTIFVADGRFLWEYPSAGGEIFVIEPEGGQPIPILPQPGERMELEADPSDLYNRYTITGSPESMRVQRLMHWSSVSRETLDTLDANVAAAVETEAEFELRKKVLDSIFTVVVQNHRDSLLQFIAQDTGSLANIMAFSQRLGNIQLVTVQEDFELYLKVDRGLQARYPGNVHAMAFHQRIERIQQQLNQTKTLMEAREKTAPGQFAPNIALPDTAGNLTSLSQLMGRVVLIDFWAAWCQPCRRQNPMLVKLYDQWNSKGFEIFSVSLDGTPQQPDAAGAWKKALIQDGMKWKWHVSDLKGGASQAAMDYGVTSIPYNVLIDREGRIIATNLTMEELPKAIEKALRTPVRAS